MTAIGLISGAISDQQYWQRAFAIKENLVKSFIFGAIMFAIVRSRFQRLVFSRNHSLGISLPQGVDVSMIGIATVSQFLPVGAMALFVVMLLARYFQLDSGLNAASSLYVIDVVKYTDKEKEILRKTEEGTSLSFEEENIKKL